MFECPPFCAVIEASIPRGSGLSSSASLEVSVMTFLEELTACRFKVYACLRVCDVRFPREYIYTYACTYVCTYVCTHWCVRAHTYTHTNAYTHMHTCTRVRAPTHTHTHITHVRTYTHSHTLAQPAREESKAMPGGRARVCRGALWNNGSDDIYHGQAGAFQVAHILKSKYLWTLIRVI